MTRSDVFTGLASWVRTGAGPASCSPAQSRFPAILPANGRHLLGLTVSITDSGTTYKPTHASSSWLHLVSLAHHLEVCLWYQCGSFVFTAFHEYAILNSSYWEPLGWSQAGWSQAPLICALCRANVRTSIINPRLSYVPQGRWYQFSKVVGLLSVHGDDVKPSPSMSSSTLW